MISDNLKIQEINYKALSQAIDDIADRSSGDK